MYIQYIILDTNFTDFIMYLFQYSTLGQIIIYSERCSRTFKKVGSSFQRTLDERSCWYFDTATEHNFTFIAQHKRVHELGLPTIKIIYLYKILV